MCVLPLAANHSRIIGALRNLPSGSGRGAAMKGRRLAERRVGHPTAQSALGRALRITPHQSALATVPTADAERLLEGLDQRTLDIFERRRKARRPRSRGWFVRRLLLIADLFGLS